MRVGAGTASRAMGRLAGYVAMVSRSRLLAPNLRRLKLTVYAGNAHRGNAVARALVARHLLALRWMNPNAQVALHAAPGQGAPTVEYELWSGETRTFEVKEKSEDETVAKILMAARDPEGDADDAAAPPARAAAAAAAAAAGGSDAGGIAPTTTGAAPARTGVLRAAASTEAPPP